MKALTLLLGLMCPMLGFAQTDEIQVYNGDLAPPGKFNLTWHQNYTPIGLKTPAFCVGRLAQRKRCSVAVLPSGR